MFDVQVLKRNSCIAAGTALATALFMNTATAAVPENVVVNVDFVDPITITEVAAMDFGLLDVNLANTETIILATNSTTSGTGTARLLGGSKVAANLTVTATAVQAVTVLIDNVTSGSGYTLGTFTCDYNAGADTGGCDGAGMSATSVASATLLVGVTLTGNGTASVGLANGNFDVTVTYQ